MLKNILKNLPKQAWIYQFLDKNWKIIYIWKSVNLKSRVNSYFNWKNKLNFAKKKMVEQIADIKYILVENETESLILETNLIKEHLPKYNILMKDGKNHIYIKITAEEFPKIIKTRQAPPLAPPLQEGKNKKSPLLGGDLEGGKYFWPYLSSNDVDNILKIIKKVFWYWVGEHNFFKNKNSYNLDKYLFEWNIKPPLNSPLSNEREKEIKKIYFLKLEKIKNFLKWNYKEVIAELEKKMLEFAKNLEFERANILKQQIESIKILDEKQIVREWIIWDYDVINYLEKFDKIFIWKIEIRNSRIIWFYPYEIENKLWEKIEDILKDFIKRNFLERILENKKIKIICAKSLDLKEKLFEKVKIENPKKWVKNDLLKMCYKNIYEFAYKKHIASLSTKWFTKQNMKNLLHILWYSRINKNIVFECNDISHLSGTHTVASRSVIENWKLAKNKYKKFRIKNLEEWKIDDFNSMREIMQRRLLEIEKTNFIPDLIIIDWWKWQLSSVIEIIEKFLYPHPPLGTSPLEEEEKNIPSPLRRGLGWGLQLVWLAKKEEELFIPLSPALSPKERKGENKLKFKKIILEKDSTELKLVQKIRDEAHRFAITFNRDSRIKSMKKNILDSLPWFGPATRKKILKNFGLVENLANVSKEELKKILNKTQIETLENHMLI